MSSVFTRAIVELETEKTGVSPLNAKCVFREVGGVVQYDKLPSLVEIRLFIRTVSPCLNSLSTP